LAMVRDAHDQYGCWTTKAEYTALAAASTWNDFLNILKTNSLYVEDSNTIQALKLIFNAP
jgi:hypothetical protein